MVYGRCFLFATPATYAALALAFNDKVTVDSAFVTGAPAPTDIAFTADGRAIITLKGGPLLVRRADGVLLTLAYPFGGSLDTSSEKGVLGVVADPQVATNSRFYLS